MKLLTDVPCGVPVTAMPAHQTYYYLFYFGLQGVSAAYSWLPRRFRESWSTRRFTFPTSPMSACATTPPLRQQPAVWERNPRCGVLVVLPWGDAAERPFFIPLPPQELQAVAEGNVALSAVNYAVGALFGFAIWLCLMVPGCLPEEKSRAFGPLIALLLFMGAMAVVWWATVGARGSRCRRRWTITAFSMRCRAPAPGCCRCRGRRQRRCCGAAVSASHFGR